MNKIDDSLKKVNYKLQITNYKFAEAYQAVYRAVKKAINPFEMIEHNIEKCINIRALRDIVINLEYKKRIESGEQPKIVLSDLAEIYHLARKTIENIVYCKK